MNISGPLNSLTSSRKIATFIARLVEKLHDRQNHAGMAREPGERCAVQVRCEVRAHRVAALLSHVLGASLGVEGRHFIDEYLDLLGPEMVREEQIAVALEALNLFLHKLHGALLVAGAAGR